MDSLEEAVRKVRKVPLPSAKPSETKPSDITQAKNEADTKA